MASGVGVTAHISIGMVWRQQASCWLLRRRRLAVPCADPALPCLHTPPPPTRQVRISGPAANVMTVRVAVTQKLRERIPGIAAVQLVN